MSFLALSQPWMARFLWIAVVALAVLAWAWHRWRRRSLFLARLRRSTRGWRESDARFQALYEQAALGVVQVDTSSLRILAANQRYCAMSGYTAQELYQRKALDLSIPEDREHSTQLLSTLVGGQIKAIHGDRKSVV